MSKSSDVGRDLKFIAIFIAALMVSAGVASWYVSPAQTAPIILNANPYSYLIYKGPNGIVYAKNGTTGVVDYSGTNAGVVINYAINNLLTAGRTTEETIILSGPLGSANNITLVSFTRLVGVNASLSLAPGGFAIFIQPPTNVRDISISDLTLTGPSMTSTNYGIYLFHFDGVNWARADNITITQCIINNFRTGISTIAYNSYFTNNFIAAWRGLEILAGSFNTITGNHFTTSGSGSFGIHMVDVGAHEVEGNFFSGDTGTTVGIDILGFAYDIMIHGNTFQSLSTAGIWIDVSASRPSSSYDITIDGNFFSSVGYGNPHGGAISIGCVSIADTGIIVSNNIGSHLDTFITVGASGSNIANEVSILGNTVYTVGHMMLFYGNAYNISLYGNKFFSVSYAPVIQSGQLSAEDNLGFTTRNSGSFSTASNGTWVNAGLALQATQVSITLSTKGYAWYGGLNSTGFFLYFSTATASGTWSARYGP